MLTVLAACSPQPVRDERIELSGPFDFGTVKSGDHVVKTLTLHNAGPEPIVLAAAQVDDSSFQVADVTSVPVAAGAWYPISVTFEPMPTLSMNHHATLAVRTTRDARATATLDAVSIFVDCRATPDVEFLGVQVGDTAHQRVTFVNRSAVAADFGFGAIGGSDGAFFGAPAPRTVNLLPGQSHEVDFTFSPTAERAYLATVNVGFQHCATPRPLILSGLGVAHVLACSVTEVVPNAPGQPGAGVLAVRNAGAFPVELSALTLEPAPEFALVDAGAGVVPPSPSFAPHQRLLVPYVVTPAALGKRSGTFTAATTLPAQPLLTCAVEGSGAGPDIEVSPLLVEVPADGGVGVVTIRNTAPAQGPAGLLRLLSHLAPPPLIVQLPMPAAVAPGASAEIAVSTFSVGDHELTLNTNDLDEPRVTVIVRASP